MDIISLKPCHVTIVQGKPDPILEKEKESNGPELCSRVCYRTYCRTLIFLPLLPNINFPVLVFWQRTTQKNSPSHTSGDCSTSSLAPPPSAGPPIPPSLRLEPVPRTLGRKNLVWLIMRPVPKAAASRVPNLNQRGAETRKRSQAPSGLRDSKTWTVRTIFRRKLMGPFQCAHRRGLASFMSSSPSLIWHRHFNVSYICVFPRLDDESPTSANLGNDHDFIIKKYSPHWYKVLWGKPKAKPWALMLKVDNIILL